MNQQVAPTVTPAPSAPIEHSADQGDSSRDGWHVTQLVVEDGLRVPPGGMGKNDFLDQLKQQLEAMVDEETRGTMWQGADCPWIDHYIERYRARPTHSWQRLIELWAVPQTSTTATALMAAIVDRSRRSVREWREQGGSPIPPIPGEIDAMISVGDVDGGLPSLFRWADDGAAPVEPAAAHAAAHLGPGTAVPAGIASRFAPDVGPIGPHVRLHLDDSATRVSRDLDARGFAVGDHVGIRSDLYAPGTPAGDALIAHELAHATSSDHDGDSARAEAEADAVAERSVLRLWAGVTTPRPERSEGRPKGLALHACGTIDERDYVDSDHGADGNRTDPDTEILTHQETEQRGYDLSTPGGHTTLGRTYRMQLHYPAYAQRPESMHPYAFTGWYVRKPGEDGFTRHGGLGVIHEFELDQEGSWAIIADIHVGGSTKGRLRHDIEVVSQNSVAESELDEIETSSLVGFYSGIEFQRLQNRRYGVRDQTGTPFHIALTTGSNPRMPDPGLSNAFFNEYEARFPDNVSVDHYRWIGVPENISDYPRQGVGGRRNRRTIEGLDGFELGSSRTARWTMGMQTGIVNIHCFMYDAQNTIVGRGMYRQVILNREERAASRAFDAYSNEVREETRKLVESTATHLAAVHINTSSGASTEVSLFMGRHFNTGRFVIVDVTPGVSVRYYEGADFATALDDFNGGNSYPPGRIRLRIPTNELGVRTAEWTVHTSGQSTAQRLSSVAGWASLGLAGLGALAALSGVAAPAAPIFFLASAGAGAVSAGAGLYQSSQEVRPSGMEIAINLASLAGSLIGMAGAANILRHGPRLAALTTTHRFVMYSGFAADGVGGVLMAAHSATEIADMLDSNANAEEKATAIVRILGGMLLTGGLLAWGARDLGAARRQVASVVDPAVAENLPTPDVHALSILEPGAMARLGGADLPELQSIARLIREDPVRASALAARYGEHFVVAARSGPENLEQLAQALHIGRPEAAGTRGSYAPAPAAGSTDLPPTYTRGGHVSPGRIWRRIRSNFVNQQTRHVAEGATLRTVGTITDPHTRFELVIPASADGAHPQMIIPVRIESTMDLPTSVHGGDTGPVAMSVRSSAPSSPGDPPGYSVEIDVHHELREQEIANAVGHELDELVGIARRGVRGDAITAQKRASLLQAQAASAGDPPPAISAHDEAAARELAQTPTAQQHPNTRPAHFAMPPEIERRAIEMGFGSTTFLEEKLSLLRRHGVDEDLLGRLRALAHGSEIRAQTGTMPSIATPRIVGHLVNAGSGAPNFSPVSGLHLESALQRRQAEAIANNEGLHLLSAGDSPQGNHSYEQWVWTGTGDPPAGSRPTTPARTAGAMHGDWRLASEPKTTVDDLAGFMTRAQTAFDSWQTANPGSTGGNLQWQWPPPGTTGVEVIGGRVAIDGTGAVTHRTVYPVKQGGLASW